VRADRHCVVVGAGLLGLAAARALSRRGWRVTVLEAAGSFGHPRAGSKGDARIFRLGYPERHYVELARRASELWRELERETGRQLLHPRGQLSFGDEPSVAAVAAALEAAGCPGRRLSADEVAARFPGLDIAGEAIFEPGSAVLAADDCLAALGHDEAFALEFGAPVTEVRTSGDGIGVVTATGAMHEGDIAVVCAGPGTPALVTGLAAVAPASLPQVAYFRPARHHSMEEMPIFIEWGEDMIYGLPVPRVAAPGLYKVSHHTPGAPLPAFDPAETAPLADDDPELLGRLVGAVERLLPGLDPEPVATERCVYDNTVDGDFVLDRLDRVVVGSGTSGHGFKFGPLFGEILADLAEGATPTVDLAPFSVRRRAPGGDP
jgi:sarcosine oxidase